MMQKKQVMRYYFAIATGEIISGETIEQPISRHSTKRTKMQVNPNGKKAITHYRIAKRLRGHTVLDVQLDTGRTHQIRVHLSWKGFPIVGDKTYGWRPKLTSGMDELLKKTLQQLSRKVCTLSFSKVCELDIVNFKINEIGNPDLLCGF